MTKQQTREAIEVMQAYVMGKTIEVRGGGAHWEWTKLILQPPSWNWKECEYRIAPEPMEIEVWVNPDGSIVPSGFQLASTGCAKKKFREVL